MKTLVDIENAKPDAIRPDSEGQLAALAVALEAATSAPGELARRYVQARFDAARRDETCANQARTIESLNDGIGAGKELIAKQAGELDDLRRDLAQAAQGLRRAQEIITATQEAAAAEAARLNADAKSLRAEMDEAIAALQKELDQTRREREEYRLAVVDVQEDVSKLLAKLAHLWRK